MALVSLQTGDWEKNGGWLYRIHCHTCNDFTDFTDEGYTEACEVRAEHEAVCPGPPVPTTTKEAATGAHRRAGKRKKHKAATLAALDDEGWEPL